MDADQTRRRFLTASGAALTGIGAATQTTTAWTTGAPTLTDRSQPTIGTNPNAPTATVYGSFSCPYTEEFVKEGNLERIIEEYVEPGHMNLEFRPLEYDPEDPDSYWISGNGAQAGQAAYGVWEEDPNSFWEFFTRTWQEMPGWITPTHLEEYMNDAGVTNASKIASNLKTYDSELKVTANTGSNDGIIYTPQMKLDGDLTGPRNDWVFDFIEARIDTAETLLGVTTDTASDIERGSAIINGKVTGLGGASQGDVWVRYWTAGSDGDDLRDSDRVSRSTGTFGIALDDLDPNTTYRYRTFIRTGSDWDRGDIERFTTTGADLSIETIGATNIGRTAATMIGDVESLGGADEGDVWVRYWTAGNNGEDIRDTDRVSHGAGRIGIETSDLEPNTTYRYRVFVRTGRDWDRGDIQRFTTN